MGTVISRLRVRASARMKARTSSPEYEEEGFDDDEEVEDVEPELDPAEYEDDEAYARVLQDAEEREVSAQLMGPHWDSAIVYGFFPSSIHVSRGLLMCTFAFAFAL
ncbi:hypothetical protein TRIUR3_30740 [Triticum urartu]|uniref:Uncharacterized protein n=1 Tax=Triticum urartu TaxID=4572 RepID=M7ZMW2_TRIUA|nr:hypothetical protein TRIUR3_30740 [Triticum urartu]